MPTLADYNSTHDPDATTCTLITKHIYGGGKKANMSSGTNIVLGCMPDGWIDEIYAGAKAADVAGDVCLTITSGKFGRVFGGNKDSGKLEGSITVNIEETGGCDVPIVIGELYGGGNLAGYSIYGYDSNGDPIENEADKTVTTPYADPQVNVRAFTSIGAIYGGGYSALMVGNPTIDINVAKGSHADNATIHSLTEGNENYFPEGNTATTPSLPYPAHKLGEIGAIGNVFGGGNLANVIGNTTINIGTETEIPFISSPSHLTKNTDTNKYPVSGANITGNVYGGGNAADIIGNTTVTIGTVDLTGEGKDGTKIGVDVFGGGFGSTTTVTGNVEVNIGAETDDDYVGYATISGNVYGGSAEGKVNATKSGTETITYATSSGTPTTEVNLYGGTITGNLYGGGYGLNNAEADVYGAVSVNVYGGTVPNVFGGNNLSGVTRNTVSVNIAGGTISENVYGGGNAADAIGNVTVTVTDGSMVDVFGAGFGQTTVVGGDVTVNIGEKDGNTLNGNATITGNVYGGSAKGAVNATKGSGYSSDPTDISATPDKTTAVNIYAFESLPGNVFGGGLGDVAGDEGHSNITALNYGNTTVTMEGGTVGTAVYGGANINGTLKAKSTVTITGGTVGTAPAANQAIKDVVFGGGFGQPTLVEGDVVVNIGKNEGNTLSGNATIHGSVYGGSALGNVNAYDNNGTLTASTYTVQNETAYRGTNVNLYKGTINGNLYGGGLGRQYAAAVQGTPAVEPVGTEGQEGYVPGSPEVPGTPEVPAVLANVYGPVTVTVKNGEVTDVFGCNNLNGSPQKDVDVIIEGGTIDNVYGGGNLAAYTGNSGTEVSMEVSMSGGTVNYVYGGGLGETAVVNGSTSVTISNGTVNQNVFGGGQQADVTGNVGVTISGGTVTHDVYGGGAFAHTNTGNWNADSYVEVPTTNGVSLVTGLYTDQNENALITEPNTRAASGTTYYQKGNWATNMNNNGTTYKTTVRLTGGIVGNAYGGGLGQMGMAEIQAQDARHYTEAECIAYNATLVGAIAAGTQLSSTQVTAVNEALHLSGDAAYQDNGVITPEHANAYNATLQGARTTNDTKPAVAHADAVEPIEANVYGDVTVTVIGTAFTHSFETPKDATGAAIPNALDVPTTGRVFGCNNLNGTPKGDVLVEVHKTRRITDTGEVSDDHQENVFEIHSVYGGGNLATYQPAVNKATKVKIYGCKDTSIEKVFGGGNSASVPSTDVLILGTFYVGYAFSGGNGADWYQNGNAWYENNGAPVYGDATIIALGGKIGQLFGGSDTKGNVYGQSTTKLKGQDNFEGEGYETTDCPLQITNAYGAARGADIEGDVNFIVSGCNANDQIERVFGGSYDANIRGSVTLTITGGTFAQVFGGNDHGGTIGGEITVNIEETQPNCNPIIIQYLYGGGREAEYPGNGAKYITTSKDENGDYVGTIEYSAFPNASAGKNAKINVNVKSATRIDNIYGGSYRAAVNGDTEVNINMMKGNYVGTVITFPDTYRGDQIPNVDSPTGHYEVVTNLVISNPENDIPGSSVAGLYLMVHDDVNDKDIYTRITDQDAVAEQGNTYYRLTQMSGRIQDDIGTIGNVYGGGYEGAVKGNTKINIGTETTVSILKRNESGVIVDEAGNAIYDGNGKLIKGKTVVYDSTNDALGAHITGNVYGGGENGDVTGTTSVYIGTKDGSTIVPVGDSGISVAGNVFGGGKGAADNFYCNKAMVGIDGEGAIDENPKDGLPDYPNGGTTVIIANGTVGGNVYGGGQIARVEKNSVVTIGLGEGVATGTATSAPVIQGDVFGAGKGVNTHGYSALLRGNPTVTIQGNTKVRGSVYGGGEVASVARYNVVNGVPIALQNSWSGKCTVTVQGYAEIGPENNMTMPTFTGNVFGAGKGVLPYEGYTDTQKPSQVLPTGTKYFASKQEVGDGEDDDYFSFIETLALSSQTDVTIGGHAFVKGSVYGGSQNGIVQYDTKVTIQDNCQIGCGKNTNAPYDEELFIDPITNKVTTGLDECASWTYGQATGDNKFAPYDKFAGTSGYTSYASTTGDNGHTYYGNVFGGGSGKDPYAPNKWHEVAGIVRGNTQVDITGGHILTSVYGGNELTDVNGSTKVNFGGTATLGVPRTKEQIANHPVTCYLFGGGKGDLRNRFFNMTNVGSSIVTVSGGIIYGSVFGGAEDGHVKGDVIVNIQSNAKIGTWGTSYVDGNIFGGGRGYTGTTLDAGNVNGNITVNITGGTMLGSIYGGGRMASVGTNFQNAQDPNTGQFIEDDDNGTHGHVTINISGGIIGNDDENTVIDANGHTTGGNVFGGSMGRLTRLDGSPNELWTRLAQVKSSTINISGNATIKSNVYGGAEFGTTRDNVYVTIGGTRNSTTEAITHTNNDTPTINGHVYGGGYGSIEDDAAYYSVIDAGTTRYLFTPMQYAGCVGSNTEVNVVGGHVKRNVYGGGEMASVGVIDYSVQEDENGDITYDNKKYSYINAHKHADIDAPGTTSEKVYGFGLSWPYEFSYIMGGKTTINVEGGRIGTGWDDGKGYVFGGGKGKAFERYKEAHLANVRETEVNIKYATTADPANKQTADCVAGAVYGGGEDGHVYEDTKITITGGLIGLSVYGGGKGLGTYQGYLRRRGDDSHPQDSLVNLPSWTAGKVYGNTYVTMSDGYVINNVYGGGYNGCVGKGNYASGIDDYYPAGYGETLRNDNLWSPSNNFNPNAAITSTNKPTTMADYFLSSGKCSVTITGGTVGTVNGTYGNVGGVTSMATPTGMVFGGSRGTAAEDVGRLSPRYAYAPDFFLGYVNNTEVIIGIRTVGNPEENGYVAGSGPTLYGQVFGGGRDGHVRNSTHVIINNGTIGQPYSTSTDDYQRRHRGNVYGSGSGMGTWNGTNHGTSSGSVTRHTIVDIYGGTIYNNVYGGGAMSSIGPPRLPINGVMPDFAPKDWSSCTVNIYGGNIGVATDYENHEYGSSVFGASRGGENSTGESEDSYTTSLWTNVNIMGGSIAGNVFGGGQNGQVKCGVDVRILDGTIGNDVYGGGALAHTNYGNWDAKTGYWAFDEHGAKYQTNVVLLGGEIKGHAYGGALGQQMREADDPNGITALDSIPAKVYGDIKVSLNGLELADYTNEYSSYVTHIDPNNRRSDYMVPSSGRGAIVKRVFGSNNMCGTPIGHVKVHVFATQHADKPDISHKYTKFGDLSEQSLSTLITNPDELGTLATEVRMTSDEFNAYKARITAATGTTSEDEEKAKKAELDELIVAIARAKYDVQGVYGGGNLAPYVPKDLSIESAEVIIDGCGFTNIYQVYGSGNAASTPATRVQVNGTHEIHEVFGGGNGADNYTVYDKEYKNPGANVGYKNYMELDSGDGSAANPYTWKVKSDATEKEDRRAHYTYGTGIAETRVAGGYIHRVYGGSNEKGNIQAMALSFYEESDDDCPLLVDQAYGQSKNAEIDAEVVQNMSCASGVKELFGGAKNADVNSNITLNITNGSSLERVFGGNNTSGLVNGSITVNVRETGCEPIVISQGLYAGGFLADYSIYGYNADRTVRTKAQYDALSADAKAELASKGIPYNSPRINVISATSISNIFGGGYQAKVVGDPHVNVNMEPGYVTVRKREKTSDDNPGDGYIYQEGDKYYVYKTGAGVYYHAPNDGNYNELTQVEGAGNENRFTHTLALGSIGNIYGGGNLADIDGDTYVEIGTGEWLNEYWQRETQSSDGHTYTYDNDTQKWSYTVTEGETTTTTPYSGNGNPTPTRNAAKITGNVFGGGKGEADDFFCRKAMVGAEGSGAIDADNDGLPDNPNGGTSVIIANGTVGGNVYGGGEIARVEKNTMVTIGIEGDETNAPTNEPIIQGDVFGAGSGVATHGYSALVRGNPTVIVQGNAKVRGSVYGGGEVASVARYKVVNGSPVALANSWSGNCIVTIRGNAEIGPVEPMQMKKAGGPDDTGHVFGAGKGVLPRVYSYADNEHKPKRMLAKNTPLSSTFSTSEAIDDNNIWEYFGRDEDYHAFIESLALSSQTHVTIGGNAFVKGSVYGGSLSGIVQYDTHVTIEGDCQIGNGDGINKRYTEYYGAWPTETQDITTSWAECAHWDYVPTEGAPYDPYAVVGENGVYEYDYTTTTYSVIPDAKRRASSDGGKPTATDGHTYYGNVYGGGSGVIPYGPGLWHRAAGLVRGNTNVNITGGHILTNVYGGNEHTDVGMYTGTNLTEPLAEGKCTINMTGGTLGVPRTAEAMSAYPLTGYIFGAGKGDPRIFFNTWTNVINTEVKISGTARIYGSTFGGGEDGHVIRDAVTNIGGTVNIDLNGDGDTTDNGETFTENGMIIGTTGTSYVDGNVFGGGRGFSGEAQTAGTVGGNVKVNIYGGTMLGSIYGGGRLASVGTQFTTPEDDNYGNFLEDSEPTYYTQAECDTYNATLAGAQVASGEITAEAANAYNATLEGARTTNDIKHYNIYGHVTINISGGTIGNATLTGNETGAEHSGNVFGGSMGRLNLLNGNRNPIWPKMAQVKTAAVNIYNKAVIRRNVYGGSELGTVRNNASVVIGGYLNPSVTDGCKAEDFKLTPTAADSTFTVSTYTDSENHAVYPIVGRDVYGGGYGSENDDTHTIFTVKEPDENNVFQKNTYAFTPMQFAGCVGQNTFVNILGGYVRKSVYGGGEMASVGIFNCRVDSTQTEPEADKVRVGYNTNTNYYYYYKNFHKHSYAENGFALSWPYDFEYVPTFEGATHINITAGRLGLKESTDENNFEENNKDNGDVYGGGKGIAGEYEKYVFCANVGSTEVNIDFTNDENKTLDPATYMNIGDCIAGAVYGGAENGHVIRDTHVTLTDGLIGHAIYGGGSGKGQFKKWLTMIPEDNRKPITNTGSGTAPNINGDQYEAICYSITAGKVFGNTNVTMKDGYVVRNIYGGGTLGSVGKGNYAGGTDDFSYYVSPAKTYNGYGEALQGSLWDNTTDNATTNKFSTAFLNSGKCTVTITGGTVGYIASDPSKSIKDGLPYGNVFGGCRGASAPNIGESPRYLYSPEFFLGYVNETEVTIGTNGATTGPKILGSVYGGGQDGHVRRDTHVTINSGEIGLAYDQETTAKTNVTKLGTANLDDSQWLARGNVYGAGSGISEYNYDFNYDGDYDDVVTYINPQTGRPSTMKETDLSTSAGSVTRFTQVDITGGIIHRNVYGGGSLASVGPPKIPPTRPDDGDNPKDVTQNRPGHQTLNLVNISSTIGTPDGYAPDIYSGNDSFKYNSVYGGEVYGASRGTDPDNTSLATSIWTEVNLLPGAHVLNNVFGGGDNGMVKQDAVVNVGLPVNITPTSLSFTQKNNESKTITVGFDAPWTAESSANWLTVTPSGTGAGTITVTAADNLPEEVGDTVSARTATITIKGIFGQRNVTVTQAGGN